MEGDTAEYFGVNIPVAYSVTKSWLHAEVMHRDVITDRKPGASEWRLFQSVYHYARHPEDVGTASHRLT